MLPVRTAMQHAMSVLRGLPSSIFLGIQDLMVEEAQNKKDMVVVGHQTVGFFG